MLRLNSCAGLPVGLSANFGFQLHLARSNAPRYLSTTPSLLAVPGSSRRKRREATRLRGQPKTASQSLQKGESRRAVKKRQLKERASGNREQRGEVTEGGSGWSGSGVWTTLQERLQASPSKKTAKRGAFRNSDDDEGRDELDDTTAEVVPFEEPPLEETVPTRESSKRKKKLKEKPAKEKVAKEKPAKKKVHLDVKTLKPQHLRLCPVEEDAILAVPKLSYDLSRVLFNPGVYHMQDARSHVFNFDPYLASIMPVDEFDFEALKRYITSSKDVKLRQLSAAHGMKYCGSTSSMTSILSHFHFLLSAWRNPNFSYLSRSLEPESQNFTVLSRSPSAAFAHYKDGVYAFDSDKEYDTENILSQLGKSMEKLFTLPKEEFEKYRRTKSHQISEEERNAAESYHYTTLGDFMMRSQLDAHDSRLPGSGMFDLKTRAVVSVRMDVRGYEKGAGYEIRKRFGQWESFEREYYDMIRTVFLKYSLQVRMGRMDGIFVAYHNTQRIFGFQYISLEEMDRALHGTTDLRLGDQEFAASISLLNELMNRATERFPGRTLRLHVETRPTKVPLTYFFVEPVTEDEMESTQKANQTSAEQLEREIRHLSEAEAEAQVSETGEDSKPPELEEQEDSEPTSEDSTQQDTQNEVAWETMMAKMEETVEDESQGIGSVREAVQDALEHSGLLKDKSELEVEQYLDAMVSSLTAQSSKIKELRDNSGHASEDIESSHLQDRTGGNNSNAGTGPVPTRNGDSESSGLAESVNGDASLKDLILKATEGIDNKAHNLKTFQRMFVDLADQSKDHTVSSDDMGRSKMEEDEVEEDEDEGEDIDEDADTASPASQQPERELLGLYVTIRNKVNGEYVERPSDIGGGEFDWDIQYTISELPDKRARTIYPKIKQRRRKVFAVDASTRDADWHKMFSGILATMAKKGEAYREERTKQEAGSPTFVAWDKRPLPDKVGKPAGEDDY